MTLKRRRKSGLFEGSPERSTMAMKTTLNTKNKKKLTKLSSTSSELVSSSSQQSAVSLLATFASRTAVELVIRKNRSIFTTTWILLLTILNLVSSSSSASRHGCELTESWGGKWFHQGFPEPLSIGKDHISGKGRCLMQRENMFLLEDSSDPALGKCFRCMVIYEKHFNVLQYKESYCEENIDSMESLCNTIAGDAPLFTMFRKDGNLVKCPFRGPHSFSYSKGDKGQVCNYPASYMDTCSDNKRLQLRYQACHDVQGSESSKEEMSCLATWKEGNRKYLVAMMNHSHVYNDESRYRCFIYQKQRGNRGGQLTDGAEVSHKSGSRNRSGNSAVKIKMAMSAQASCLGLWNVNEGYKTFELKKLQNDNLVCSFPEWMNKHHREWRSVVDELPGLLHPVVSQNGGTLKAATITSMHINKRGHSLKFHNSHSSSLESHATCHKLEGKSKHMSKIVAHVKSGCDSGYVCLVFYSRDKHVIQMRYGEKSRDPSEACLDYYFDEKKSPLITWVQPNGHNRRPCPFSGRYSLFGNTNALSDILLTNSLQERQDRKFDLRNTVLDQNLVKPISKPKCTITQDPSDTRTARFAPAQNSLNSATMYAGCSQSSSHISVESNCDYGVNYNGISERSTLNDENLKFKIKNEFVCHGAWQIPIKQNKVQNRFGESEWERQKMRRQYGGGQEARIQHLTEYNQKNRPQKLKRDIIVLSTNSYDSHHHSDHSGGKSQKLTCLSYTEMDDGTLLAKVGWEACNDFTDSPDYTYNDVIRLSSSRRVDDKRSRLSFFNISSSGPCLQALTGGASKSSFYSTSQNNCAIVMSYLIVLTFASTSYLSKLF